MYLALAVCDACVLLFGHRHRTISSCPCYRLFRFSRHNLCHLRCQNKGGSPNVVLEGIDLVFIDNTLKTLEIS